MEAFYIILCFFGTLLGLALIIAVCYKGCSEPQTVKVTWIEIPAHYFDIESGVRGGSDRTPVKTLQQSTVVVQDFEARNKFKPTPSNARQSPHPPSGPSGVPTTSETVANLRPIRDKVQTQAITYPIPGPSIEKVFQPLAPPQKEIRPSSSNLDPRPPITIVVDAVPRHFGGFCIMTSGLVKWYSVPISKLLSPHQKIHKGPGVSTEFEMKNLLFALLLFAEEIVQRKSFRIFTDNWAIIEGNPVGYGAQVHQFIKYLEDKQGVKWINRESCYLTWRNQRQDFYKFIKPADHLSRKKMNKFESLMKRKHDEVKQLEEIPPSEVQVTVELWKHVECMGLIGDV